MTTPEAEPTTKAERYEWDGVDWCPDDEACFDEEGKPTGINNVTLCANEVIPRLIAQVEALEKLVYRRDLEIRELIGARADRDRQDAELWRLGREHQLERGGHD